MKESLYDSLKAHGDSDFYPFHMPGHKRNSNNGPFSEWYKCDITEIDGFDNLHQPEGILLDAQQRAAKIFGSKETYFLINGSTAGILSAISAVAGRGKKLIMARNCHKAVYHGAFLNNLEPEYIYPSISKEFGLAEGITRYQVEDKLREIEGREVANNGQIKDIVAAVVITSPTYEGILSDVEGIVRIAHKYGIPVIVDQAHGAHFGFHEGFPDSAVSQGADFVIQSVHKTLPAPTQTAILHCNGEIVNRVLLKKYLQIYQTSSPSYLLMAGIDTCMDIVEIQGKQRLEQLLSYRKQFCHQMKVLRHIKIYPSMTEINQDAGTPWVQGMAEPGRLVIFVSKGRLTGRMLYSRLREQYHLQMEMCGADYVIAILSMMDEWDGFARLAEALIEIDAELCNEDDGISIQKVDIGKSIGQEIVPVQVIPLAKAFTAEYEEVVLEEAVGRVVSDFVNLYPPGIPLLAPGECLDESTYRIIRGYIGKNYMVQGICNDPVSGEVTIKVVKGA